LLNKTSKFICSIRNLTPRKTKSGIKNFLARKKVQNDVALENSLAPKLVKQMDVNDILVQC